MVLTVPRFRLLTTTTTNPTTKNTTTSVPSLRRIQDLCHSFFAKVRRPVLRTQTLKPFEEKCIVKVG